MSTTFTKYATNFKHSLKATRLIAMAAVLAMTATLLTASPATATTPTKTLIASPVTHNSAKLTITNHNSAWSYKYTAPSVGTCAKVPRYSYSTTVTSLTPDTSYTFKAYSDSLCSGTELASVSVATTNNILVSTSKIIVPEDGSATYTVSLPKAPTSNVTVTVAAATTGNAIDANITVSPASLTFTAPTTSPVTTGNWATPQTVTVTAAEEADKLHGTRSITHSATGYTTATVTATEGDNDVCRGTTAVGGSGVTSGKLVDDCNTLLAAKSVLAGTKISALNWSAGTAMTSWTGITLKDNTTLTTSGNHVTDIELSRKDLDGVIPNTFGDLTGLTKLWLDRNSLTGTIPGELGKLVKLEDLQLERNSLTGHIPTELALLKKLTDFDISHNALTGKISVLGQISTLTDLYANDNALTGKIPSELGELESLTLDIRRNQLTGCVPGVPNNISLSEVNPQQNETDLSKCTKGSIVLSPVFLGIKEGQSTTYTVKLSEAPTGNVPVTVGTTGDPDISVNPTSLTFTNTNWNTTQTVTVTAAADTDTLNGATVVTNSATDYPTSSITFIAVDDDVCKGTDAVGGQTSGDLVADCNKLFAAQFALAGSKASALNWSPDIAMTSWKGITLKNTTLTTPGNRVTEIMLSKSDGGQDKLTGVIPALLGDLTGLLKLELKNNELTGAIPTELGNLTKLTDLDLGNNELTGAIPTELGNLAKLINLDLGDNDLTGAIPSQLQNLTNLQSLNLEGPAANTKGLTGTIPTWLGDFTALEYLNLSYNQLTGSIPLKLYGLRPLEDAYLNDNNLTGCIPKSLLKENWDINPQQSGDLPNCSLTITGLTEVLHTLNNQTVIFRYNTATSLTTDDVQVTNADKGQLVGAGKAYKMTITPKSTLRNGDKITVTITGQGILTSIYDARTLTASAVTSNSATLTLANHTGAWYYKRIKPTVGTCTSVTGTNKVNLARLTKTTDYVYKAYSDVACTNTNQIANTASFSTPAIPRTPTFGSFGVTHNQATLILSHHTGTWYYNYAKTKGNTTTYGKCSSGVGGNIATLIDLEAAASYTYTAYSDSTCTTAKKIATDTTFTTVTAPDFTASAMTDKAATLTLTDHPGEAGDKWWYQQITPSVGTCTVAPVLVNNANSKPEGTVNLTGLTVSTSYRYRAYADAECIAELTAGDTDAAFDTLGSALTPTSITHASATLTITRPPTGDWYYKYTQPAGGTCSSAVSSGTTSVNLTGLTESTDYVYKAYSDSSCSAANELTDAAKGTSGKSDYVAATHAAFTTLTPELTATNVANDTAVLTIGYKTPTGVTAPSWTGNWWYKHTKPVGGTCTSAGTAINVNLTGLTAKTAYVYKAYSASTCTSANEITANADNTKTPALAATHADFSTSPPPGVLTVSEIADTSVKLTIANHTGNWWYQADNGTTCTAVTGTSTTVTGLTAESTYTYEAYSTNACTAPMLASTPQFITPTLELTATNVTSSTATINIDYTTATVNSVLSPSATASWSGDWWYKRFITTGGTCTKGGANGFTALSNLTDLEPHTYRAYKTSACGTDTHVASVTFTPGNATATLTASNVTNSSATLTISGHTGDWWYDEFNDKDFNGKSGTKKCTKATGTSTAVTGLTASTDYIFDAYGDSGCANDVPSGEARATFTTKASRITLTASAITGNSATLTISSGHTDAWYYRFTEPDGGSCSDEVASGTSSVNVSLTEGTKYTFKAYASKSNQNFCTNELTTDATDAEFTSSSNPVLTPTNVRYNSATLTLANHTGNWYYKYTKTKGGTSTAGTCSSVVSGTSVNLSNLDTYTTYVYKAYSDATCDTELTSDANAATFSTGEPVLTASDVTHNSAKLTLTNYPHTSGWHYKYTTPSGGQCSAKVTTATVTLTLSANETYTYKAYRPPGTGESACDASTEIVADTTAAAFTTYIAPNLGSSSETHNSATIYIDGWARSWYYKRITPAGANACSSEVKGLSTSLTGLTHRTAYRYRAYSDSACSNAITSGGEDGTDVTFSTLASTLVASAIASNAATFTISDHTGTWYYKRITPASESCSEPISGTTVRVRGLSSNTKHVVAAYSDNSCATEVTENDGNELNSTRATFTTRKTSSLIASAVTRTTATLTLTNHTSSWHSRQIAPSVETCTEIAAGTTQNLANLTPDTDYTYKAYFDSGCTVEITNFNSDADFTTSDPIPTLTVSGVTATSVKLTLTKHEFGTGDTGWYYKHTTPASGPCSEMVAKATNNVDITNLAADTSYTYKAYSDSGCTKELTTDATDAHFTTPAPTLTASDVTSTSATLTLANHTGGWYYNYTKTQGSTSTDGTCSSKVASGTSVKDLTGLSPDTTYTYTVYSDSECAIKLADNTAEVQVNTLVVTLTAVDVTHNSAKLIISNHTDGWYYTYTPSTGGSCVAVASGTSEDTLTNLSPDTTYTYKAYSDISCTSELTTDTTDATFTTLKAGATPAVTLTAVDVTSTSVKLIISNHTDEWYYKYTTPVGTCSSEVASDTSEVTLMNLTHNTKYTYKAYSDSGCTSELTTSTTDAEFKTRPVLVASDISDKSATLSISANFTGIWYYKQLGPSVGVCTQVQAGTTSVSLPGLSTDITYSYQAFTDTGCTDVSTAAVDFTTSSIVLFPSTVDVADGDQATYKVSLASDPSADATITVKVVDKNGNAVTNGAVTIDTDSSTTNGNQNTLTFTAGTNGNWSTPQTVTVMAALDVDDTSFMIKHTGDATDADSPLHSDKTATVHVQISDIHATLTASNISQTGAKLTISNRTGIWYYKRFSSTSGITPGSCTMVPAGTTSVTVSGLKAGTGYIYKAYTDPSCSPATEITINSTDADFTTLGNRPTPPPPPGTSPPPTPPAGGGGGGFVPQPRTRAAFTFTDIIGNVHAASIMAIYRAGITKGCTRSTYCPAKPVTRAQMAAFLTRALDLSVPQAAAPFTDVKGNTHADAIAAIHKAGITLGCTETTYCPAKPVTRAQMATFLTRALKLRAATTAPPFTDVEGSVHADSIGAIYRAGITKGCTRTTYCPAKAVTRAQMAAFLARALKLL